jgi:SAM-dependent methyltransferase
MSGIPGTRWWRGVKRHLRESPSLRFLYGRYRKCRSYLAFLDDYRAFVDIARTLPPRLSIRWKDRFPCLDDNTGSTEFDRHYVYHTAWAARVLARAAPTEHVDISSFTYFSTIVSAFLPVRSYDYHPLAIGLDNLSCHFADLNKLPFDSGTLRSLSCMHVVEHIGLGRYGDRLDPEGDLKAAAELKRVLAPGGQLLFVVPVGEPRIQFNAHRIYGFVQVLQLFEGLTLEEFSLIPDSAEHGGLIRNALPSQVKDQRYGCGCFLFGKPPDSVNP